MEDSILSKIRVLYYLIGKGLNKNLKKLGVSGAQSRVLALISINGEKGKLTTQKDVEAELGFNKSTTSELLSSMIARNLIYKDYDEETKTKVIKLTEEGKKLDFACYENLVNVEKLVQRYIEEQEIKQFYKTIDQMIANVEDDLKD